MENNINNLNDEEATLIAKLAAIRIEKERINKYNYDWDEAINFNTAYDINKQAVFIKVTSFHKQDGVVYISLSKSDKLSSVLETYQAKYMNRLTSPLNYSIKWEQWQEFKEKNSDVSIKYENETEVEINTYTPPPPFSVSLDNAYGKLNVKASERTSTYELRVIPGCAYYNGSYHIPLTEAWRVYELLNSKYPTSEWTDEAKQYAVEQITKRMQLDIIAQKEVADNPIVMNGMKFHDYQTISVEFVEARGGSCVIAHEMGLGKTPISLALIERLIKNNKPRHLIVCPASLIPNWIAQIKKWTGAKVYRFDTEKPLNTDIANWLGNGEFNYFIINYDILSTVTKVKESIIVNDKGETIKTPADTKQYWVELLNMRAPDSITVDEGHYIKNVAANRSKAVRDLVSDRKVLLTGTPLLNRPPELWALIKCVDEQLAGGFEGFVKAYTVDGKSAKNIDELRETLKTVMFRRTKAQVVKELPPINRIIREYELTPTAKSIYNKALEGLWMELDDWDGNTSNAVSINGILAQILKLKQICAQDMISYTVDLANEAYEQSEGNNRKILIFSQFVNKPEVCKEICARLNIAAKASGTQDEAIYFTGADSPQERQNMVKEFTNNPNLHYLVASTKAASEGLDITAAGTVIFHDLMWTPAAHHQAEGRAYGRMSDMHSIDSYYIVALNTIMQDIMSLLERKLELFNAVIEGAELSRNDVSIAMEVIKSLKDNRKRIK